MSKAAKHPIPISCYSQLATRVQVIIPVCFKGWPSLKTTIPKKLPRSNPS